MKQIDASLLQKMLIGGAKYLEARKEYINELNVFPVPDGDTGTNMTMTAMAAAKEVAAANLSIKEITRGLSSGSLRGARGNSGVILSQLFRGFYKGVKEEKVLNTRAAAAGFKYAADTAYKAVMKPKEGTILTVARAAADAAVRAARQEDDFEKFAKIVLEEAETVLKRTPEMLPVLKEAGVVDSGGQGLVEFLRGAVEVMLGKEIEIEKTSVPDKPVSRRPAEEVNGDIKYGYCTEFIVMVQEPWDDDREKEFKSYLSGIGDCVVVVGDEEIVKVHVHTNHPGKAIEKGLSFGELTSMKIDNMREEHQERFRQAGEQEKEKEPIKPYGFIAVSIGDGLNEIFRELGVDYLIEGGQTMNPSTEDMLDAIDQVHAETIFILPNNKNIILAATQAQSLTEDKEIIILPTQTIPQGISAFIGFEPGQDVDSNVRTGEVTYAVRDTSVDGKKININDIMGIDDEGIREVGGSIEKVTLDLLDDMTDEDSELISVYYGQDISQEDAEALAQKVEEKYPDCDISLEYGGQPVYYYLLSVE